MKLHKWEYKYTTNLVFRALVDTTTSRCFSGDIEYDDVIGIMVMVLERMEHISYEGAELYLKQREIGYANAKVEE